MNSIFLAICIAFLWGISPIIFKYLLGDIDMKVIMFLTAIVYTSCAIIYIIPSWNGIIASIRKISNKHLVLIVINAIVMTFLANLLFLMALKNNSKTYLITAIAFCAPLFSLLIAFFFLNQKLTWYNIIGMTLTIMGIFVLSYYQ